MVRSSRSGFAALLSAPSAWRCCSRGRSRRRTRPGVAGRRASPCRVPSGNRGPAPCTARPTGRASRRCRQCRTEPGSPRRGRATPGRSCRLPRSARASGRHRTRTAVATVASTSSAPPDSPCSPPATALSCSPGRSAPGASCRWTTTTACAPRTSRCAPRCGRGRWSGQATCSGCWKRAIPAARRMRACTGVCAAGSRSTWTRWCSCARPRCGCCRYRTPGPPGS
jgi:hypothetical protein